jgi:ssDNA thymidine ADP-ribosyltransferase, DarT
MPVDINNLWVFRIIHYQNLEYILQHGVYYRNNPNFPANYVNIGNPEIINSRDTKPVTCFPGTMVNDYVPFYFAIRTPMLYNIYTSYGVVGHEQHEIIYLCCNVGQIIGSNLQWCFTNGNAAIIGITRFYNDTAELDNLDWHSIRTTDFRDDNADGDPDRKRKKHAEFLVRNHVPIEFIQSVVVYNQERHDYVAALVAQYNRNIAVRINPNNQFYF